jgi:hypothetical protein
VQESVSFTVNGYAPGGPAGAPARVVYEFAGGTLVKVKPVGSVPVRTVQRRQLTKLALLSPMASLKGMPTFPMFSVGVVMPTLLIYIVTVAE